MKTDEALIAEGIFDLYSKPDSAWWWKDGNRTGHRLGCYSIERAEHWAQEAAAIACERWDIRIRVDQRYLPELKCVTTAVELFNSGGWRILHKSVKSVGLDFAVGESLIRALSMLELDQITLQLADRKPALAVAGREG